MKQFLKRNLWAISLAVLALITVTFLVVELALPKTQPQPTLPQNISEGFVNGNQQQPAELAAKQQESRRSSYQFDLLFQPDQKQMKGSLHFVYYNDTKEAMDELRFLLYPNSFEKQEYGIFNPDDMASAYPQGFSPGSITMSQVVSPQQEIDYEITGAQNHVLVVHLSQTVAPEETVALNMQYTVTIPQCYGRFGYGKDTWSLVNCNPILAVYDEGIWYDYPYVANGDPFYSKVADYTATITAPANYTIASTGVMSMTEDGEERMWSVSAPLRRDFGFVASDSFDVLETQIGKTLVRSYYLRGNETMGRRGLDIACSSLNDFSQKYGPYIYSEFSVVQTDFFIGGMEYPGMVLIDNTLYDPANQDVFDLVVAHETAHQWWYAAVGNDQVIESWLDEALTEFSTNRFLYDTQNPAIQTYLTYYNSYMRAIRENNPNLRVDSPSTTFPADDTVYSAWVYSRGADILDELRQSMGDASFYQAMADYYKQNKWGVATRQELVDAFKPYYKGDLNTFLDSAMGKAD